MIRMEENKIYPPVEKLNYINKLVEWRIKDKTL